MDIGKTLFMILRDIKKLVMRNLSGEVTFLEFKCLKIVYQNPITQKEIIEETGMTKGTVSKALRSLEERGFVTRRRVGREYRVEITEEGKAVMRKFEKIASEINEILLKNFTEDEKQTLQTLLKKMLRNLEQVDDET
jgi:DNA-binding MarR family transcriptional regulator